MHIILHALSLVVVVQCVTGMNINYQHFKLRDRRKTQQSTLPRSSLYSNCKNIRQRVKIWE